MGKAVYTMGSADPRVVFPSPPPRNKWWQKIIDWFRFRKVKSELISQCPSLSAYRSFSGIDVKARFVMKDGSIKTIPELQAFSVKKGLHSGVTFDLSFILFDRSSLYDVENAEHIIFYAANEYGSRASFCLWNTFLIDYSTGMSIDDLISEEKMVCRASRFSPWTNWEDNESGGVRFAKQMHYQWMLEANPEAAEVAYPKEFRDRYFKEENK